LAKNGFYGCPFINAVAEHDQDQKQFAPSRCDTRRWFWAHIEKTRPPKMGGRRPELLAHKLALLIDDDRCAMVSRNPGVADTAGLAAGRCSRLPS